IANNAINLDNFSVLSKIPDDGQAGRELESAFRQVLNSEGTIREIRFVGLDGTVLVSVPDERKGSSDKNELYYLTLHNNLPKQRNNDVFISKLSDDLLPAHDFVAVPVVQDQAVGFVVVNVDITGAANPAALSIYRALRPLTTKIGTINF